MQLFELESGPGGHPEQAFGHLLAANQAQARRRAGHGPDVRLLPQPRRVRQGRAAGGETGGAERRQVRRADVPLPLRAGQGRPGRRRGRGPAAHQAVRATSPPVGWSPPRCCRRAASSEEARDDYLEVLKRQPGQYEAYQGLVDCFYKLDKPDQAKLTLEEARRVFPDDVRLREHAAEPPGQLRRGDQRRPRAGEDPEGDTRSSRRTPPTTTCRWPRPTSTPPRTWRRPSRRTRPGCSNKAFETLATGKEKFPQEPPVLQPARGDVPVQPRPGRRARRCCRSSTTAPTSRTTPSRRCCCTTSTPGPTAWTCAEQYLNEAMVRADNRGDATAVDLRLRLAALYAQEKKFADAYAALDGGPAERPQRPARHPPADRDPDRRGQAGRGQARPSRRSWPKHDTADLGNLLASLLIDERQLARGAGAIGPRADPRPAGTTPPFTSRPWRSPSRGTSPRRSAS